MNGARHRRPFLTARRRRVVCVLLALLTALAWWGWVPNSFTDPACHVTSNGAWIGVEWTSQPIDPRAIANLAQQATKQHLRYLFPFTTYVKADRSFSPSYTYARAFVAAFHQHNQQTALLAWVGLPHQHVEFANPQVRTTIITFIASLITTAGFDGVHINAEPIPNGDPDYLQFLDELRLALAPTQLLSVASLPWASTLESALLPANPYRWTSSYYHAVASRVDQIVAMTYDSQAVVPALYRLWMREQVQGIRQSISDQPIDLLIGISLSREVTSSHRPEVENLANGLAGLCAGLAKQTQDGASINGVALYAFWESDARDWQIWQSWQGSE